MAQLDPVSPQPLYGELKMHSVLREPFGTAISRPYLIFLGDTTRWEYAKTALGLREWAPQRCLAEWALPGCTVSTGLPSMTPAQAVAAGARSLVIGVANSGGVIPESWLPPLLEALEQGLDLVSGMHERLGDIAALKSAAERRGRKLLDVRAPPNRIPVASGRKRTGKRLLTVGTDCALGKKYTALALTEAFRARGVHADFRATGQTGILIAGDGIAVDAVVSDFIAGAAELLSPDARSDHWDVIEGQGSPLHPAYAAVATGLLHGSQPDVVVICHEPGREHILGYPSYPLPSIEDTIDAALLLGRRTNPAIRCAGISLNTSLLSHEAAERECARISQRLRLPTADPMRRDGGFDHLVEACLE